MADHQTGSSTSAFVSSLIFNLIIFAIFIAVFIFLKNRKYDVYSPRSINRLLPDHLKAPPLSNSAFGWLPDLLSKPSSFIIQQAGIDGYFFLRYMWLWAKIGFISGLIIWPILFSVNATGGGHKTGFDIISYSNNIHKWRVFANLFCSWFFFGFVVYTIYSELVYYTGFRHNLECTPFYKSLPSSKVLLIDNVPEEILNDSSLRQLFPAVKRIAITRNTKEASEIYEKRTKLVGKLEGAFVKVMSKCVKIKYKLDKKAAKGKDVEYPTPSYKVESYIKEKKLPTYRYKPIIGEKKHVFNEGIEELKEFNDSLDAYQEKVLSGLNELEKVGSVFLEFPTFLELQRAYQAIDSSDKFKRSRKFQSFFPKEVIWNNVGTGFTVRKSKKTGAVTFLTAMIIFWAIPVAVVGCISNINYLTEKVPFLRFINNMPSVLMGIITGILPSVLLSILMSLVPPIIKWMGKIGGCMTEQQLDQWTQQWYFAFQVIQVFLVTTCTSAASSVVTSIIDNPSSAMQLLANNLPPASNFYISYLLLQGLSVSSGILAQVVGLVLSYVIGRILDTTPRQKWNREVSLSAPSWGTMYATFGLFTVIMLCYAIIAPIIIAFTSIAFILIVIAQMYTFIYVSGHATDNRGRNYPLALFETFVGIYLGELSLVALFVMQKNWACVVLEAVWVALTVAAHLYFRYLFEPVLDTVPIGAIEGYYPVEDMGRKQVKEVGEKFFVEDTLNVDPFPEAEPNTIPVDKMDDSSTDSYNGAKASLRGATLENKGTNSSLQDESTMIADVPPYNTKRYDNKKTSEPLPEQDAANVKNTIEEYLDGGYQHGWRDTINKFIHPKRYVSYSNFENDMPAFWSMPISKVLVDDVVYEPPEIRDRKRAGLWIAKDELGLSENLIDLCAQNGVLCTNADAIMSEKGKVELAEDSYPPDYEPTILY